MALEEGARDAEEDSSRPIGPVVGQSDSNLQRGGAEVAEKRRGICVILLFSAILRVLPACLKDLIEAGRRDSAL